MMYLILENNILEGQHVAIIFGGVVGFLRTRTFSSGFGYDPRDRAKGLDRLTLLAHFVKQRELLKGGFPGVVVGSPQCSIRREPLLIDACDYAC